MLKQKFQFIFLCIWLFQNLFAQTDFRLERNLVPTDGIRSTLCSGFVDVNGDGWDDLVRLNGGTELSVELISANELKTYTISFGKAIQSPAWALAVADINNDGVNEIMVTGSYSGARILSFEQTSLRFIQVTGNQIYSQASNFVDINNDGWIDLFICNDEGLSDVYLNDQTGWFLRDEEFIDMTTVPISDNSGNYGSEWTDIDLDGDLDLYIAKCKASATEQTDPRRINVLFLNKADTGFVECAKQFGLAISDQSWACNFGDLDNDGDLDAFVLNHGAPYTLLEQIDGDTFIYKITSIDSISGFGLQSIMRDFDNNGFQDILISGDQQYLLYNYGDFEFDVIKDPLEYYNPVSFSVGDINRDGFLDLYTTYSNGLTNKGFIDDLLWVNLTNANHYVAFRLIGTASNANGIGANIKIYGAWGVQIRELKSGESYGIMNSLNVHFGLGQYETIDSMRIEWPSGSIDKYYNIESDRYYNLTESVCITSNQSLDNQSNRFCAGDSILLSTSILKDVINEWSTGESSEEIWVRESGVYHLISEDDEGCIVPSDPVYALENPEDEELSIESGFEAFSCHGDSIQLTGRSVLSEQVIWKDDFVGANRWVMESGEYIAMMDGTCSTYSDTIKIELIDPNEFVTFNDTIQKGANATIYALGDQISWFDNPDSNTVIHQGDSLEIPDVLESRIYYAQNQVHFQFDSFTMGEMAHQGSTEYSADQLNGKMFFESDEEFILESVTVGTDTSGKRTILLIHEDSLVLEKKDFNLDTGASVLHLNYLIPPGKRLVLTTDQDTNALYLGFQGPRLVRSNEGSSYPYTSNGIRIMNSSFGPQYYLYFYDWVFRKPGFNCTSNRKEVKVVVDVNSATEKGSLEKIKIYPVPASQILYIAGMPEATESFRIYNVFGRMVGKQKFNWSENLSIEISDLAKGVYYLVLSAKDQRVLYSSSFVKVD